MSAPRFSGFLSQSYRGRLSHSVAICRLWVLTAFAAACVSSGQAQSGAAPAPRNTTPPVALPAATPTPGEAALPGGPAPVRVSASYVLSPGDSVALSVYDEPRLEATRTLTVSGEASFHLIGNVKIAGKTVSAAEKLIEELYQKDYLVTPRVSLTLTAHAVRSVTVAGAVAKPQLVPIPQEGRFDVLMALEAAGGATEKANLREAVLRRFNGGNIIACDILALNQNPASAPVMQPNDSLSIPFKVDEFVIVSGEVNKPGQVKIPEKGPFDALSAISMAGDYTKFAKVKDITVTRAGRIFQLDGTAMSNGSARPFLLLPGDRLKVGKRIF